jgi:cell division protein FtsB
MSLDFFLAAMPITLVFMVKIIFSRIRQLIERPQLVLIFCLAFALSSLLLNGTFIRLWGLYRDQGQIEVELKETVSEIKRLNIQLKEAKDPAYIERQARDKLDYAGEHDLIFLFAENP